MSVAVAARASNYKVIFDGQSLNWSGGSTSFPNLLMAGRGIHTSNVAISGFAWTQLKNMVTGRLTPYLLRSNIPIIIGVGGTTDYAVNQTGAAVYASEVTWANNLRAATSDYVYIIQTTTTPSTSFTGAQDTNRITGNGLVVADASGAFDYTVDLAGDSRLSDATNTTYFSDGTHPTLAGRQAIAELLGASLDLILS
jgi:hypothetical protein